MQKIEFFLEHLLFTVYLVLFAWLVTTVPFFKKSGLTPAQLIILFLLKVITGIFYGWIGVYYGELAQMVDTWAYHYQSLKEVEILKNHPFLFFSDIASGYEHGYGRFFLSENSWWNDIKATLLIKLIALFNLFSFNNYYVNVIFYSFLTFFGPIAVYRVMAHLFPSEKIAVLLATFLIPSFLYWTSGIHKDGLLFVGFALVGFHLYFGFLKEKFSFSSLFIILFSLFLILAFRNYLIPILIPAIISYALSKKIKLNPLYVFGLVYFFFIIAFFTVKYIHPDLDIPAAVAVKQQDFLKLRGHSAVEVDSLRPTFFGFVANAPQAITLSAIRPYPSDIKHLLSLAAAAEINFLLLLFALFLFYRKPTEKRDPFLVYCLFLSFSVLFMIGYTVNFLGAIVRYRSIVLPFLVIPMVAKIDWIKIGKLLFTNINNKNNK